MRSATTPEVRIVIVCAEESTTALVNCRRATTRKKWVLPGSKAQSGGGRLGDGAALSRRREICSRSSTADRASRVREFNLGITGPHCSVRLVHQKHLQPSKGNANESVSYHGCPACPCWREAACLCMGWPRNREVSGHRVACP